MDTDCLNNNLGDDRKLTSTITFLRKRSHVRPQQIGNLNHHRLGSLKEPLTVQGASLRGDDGELQPLHKLTVSGNPPPVRFCRARGDR